MLACPDTHLLSVMGAHMNLAVGRSEQVQAQGQPQSRWLVSLGPANMRWQSSAVRGGSAAGSFCSCMCSSRSAGWCAWALCLGCLTMAQGVRFVKSSLHAGMSACRCRLRNRATDWGGWALHAFAVSSAPQEPDHRRLRRYCSRATGWRVQGVQMGLSWVCCMVWVLQSSQVTSFDHM